MVPTPVLKKLFGAEARRFESFIDPQQISRPLIAPKFVRRASSTSPLEPTLNSFKDNIKLIFCSD